MTSTCRVDRNPLLPLLSLGNIALNAFPDDPSMPYDSSPLALGIDPACGLVQLTKTPDQDSLYLEYWYRSGTNESMVRSLREIVETAVQWVPPPRTWLDIGCNDGTLLSLVPHGVTKLGIDPAKNLAPEAILHCTDHRCDYFSAEAYGTMSLRPADVITSIAMFYDLENPVEFVRDIEKVLAPNGVWILQLSYTPLMVRQNAFDNICHEHLEYYTLYSFRNLMHKCGMRVVDVELNDVNAGSFRVVVQRNGDKNPLSRFQEEVCQARIQSLLEWEHVGGFSTPKPYLEFAKKIEFLKQSTVTMLQDLKRKRQRVIGYGASTKGNTLLQYYGIGPELVEAVAERHLGKWGRYTVATGIPIISEEEMRRRNPDYLFVLPWHFIRGFVRREADYLRGGGKMIVPLPELEVIDGS